MGKQTRDYSVLWEDDKGGHWRKQKTITATSRKEAEQMAATEGKRRGYTGVVEVVQD